MVVLASLLALAVAAPPAERVRVGAGVTVSKYPWPSSIPVRTALELSARYPGHGWEAGGTVRFALPEEAGATFAGEGVLAGAIAPRVGRWWRPAAGLELAVSTSRYSERLVENYDPGDYLAVAAQPGPVWVDFTVSLLRFSLGRATVSVGDFAVGAGLVPVGRHGRWSVAPARVAWTF